MRRGFIVFGIVAGLMAALTTWLVSQTQFSYRHPRQPSAKIIVTRDGARVEVLKTPTDASAIDPARKNAGPARAVLTATTHDFGLMDPLAKGGHDFVVRNTGSSPLTIEVASTTCKCTVAGVRENTVPPGGEGQVRLEWTVPKVGRFFKQLATIKTNDPAKPNFQLAVEGIVRTLVGTDVEEFTLSMEPDEPATAEALIFSEQFERFAIAKVDSKIPGLKWADVAADQREISSLPAKSVRKLELILPGDMTTTEDFLLIDIQPLAQDGSPLAEPKVLPQVGIPLHVKMKRRLAVYGPAMRDSGVIEMGETQQGVAKTIKLLLKVRDTDRSLPIENIELTPRFLKATVTPHDEKSSQTGLYDLIIEIPTDAQPCQLLGESLGQIRLITGHPRIGEFPLAIRLAVLPAL